MGSHVRIRPGVLLDGRPVDGALGRVISLDERTGLITVLLESEERGRFLPDQIDRLVLTDGGPTDTPPTAPPLKKRKKSARRFLPLIILVLLAVIAYVVVIKNHDQLTEFYTLAEQTVLELAAGPKEEPHVTVAPVTAPPSTVKRAQLAITDSKAFAANDEYVIQGNIRNESAHKGVKVSITASISGKEGAYLGSQSVQLGTIYGHTTRKFTITFHVPPERVGGYSLSSESQEQQ